LIVGAGVNSDDTGITGTLSLLLSIEDTLHENDDANNEYFKLDEEGNPLGDDELILGIVDTDVDEEE
jgi:hypothetical protein